MRTFIALVGAIALTAIGFSPSAAQEAHEVTLTGCLAAETTEGEVEYQLRNIDTEMDMESVHLVAAEGIDLGPHVGHTVEVTGTAVTGEGHGEMEMEEEHGEEEHGMEATVKVTGLSHVAASCSEG